MLRAKPTQLEISRKDVEELDRLRKEIKDRKEAAYKAAHPEQFPDEEPDDALIQTTEWEQKVKGKSVRDRLGLN